jgi:cytochrome c nitrite reductase small subunit
MAIPRRSLVVLAAMVGLLVGLGAATAHKAKAFSYLSNEPEVCANCHIMQPQLDSWQKSSHHAVARCVDCHLPHDFVGKYVAKAENGYHHSKGFTFQDFPEPIVIKAKNARILQQNCERCHADLVHDQFATRDAARPADALTCTHCHDRVGHGDTAGLGGPLREDELPPTAPATTPTTAAKSPSAAQH